MIYTADSTVVNKYDFHYSMVSAGAGAALNYAGSAALPVTFVFANSFEKIIFFFPH
jgi:hypothetical protein